MPNDATKQIEALQKRVDQLERANKPPEPFKPDPDWAPINPIDRVSICVTIWFAALPCATPERRKVQARKASCRFSNTLSLNAIATADRTGSNYSAH